jgi:hypothetical protein
MDCWRRVSGSASCGEAWHFLAIYGGSADAFGSAGQELLIYDLTLGAVFWIAAALVLAFEARHTGKYAIRIGSSRREPFGHLMRDGSRRLNARLSVRPR